MERSASGMTDAKFGLTLIAVSVPVLLVHELAVSWRRVENALHGLMLVPGETVAKEVNGKSTQTLQVFRPRRATLDNEQRRPDCQCMEIDKIVCAVYACGFFHHTNMHTHTY